MYRSCRTDQDQSGLKAALLKYTIIRCTAFKIIKQTNVRLIANDLY